MEIKKMFFPIGAGGELRERIHGALLVSKYFNTHLDIMACQFDPQTAQNIKMTLRGRMQNEFLNSAQEELKIEQEEYLKIFNEECKKLGIEICDAKKSSNSAKMINAVGFRSKLVEKYSKYCDLVIAAVPQNGKITGTFESAVLKSGKSCIVIPRVMKEFKADKILLCLTGSASSARALTNSLFLLKKAKKVHCIMTTHMLESSCEETKQRVKEYLALHDIDVSFEIFETSGKIPGQVLIEASQKDNYDLIVAGMEAEKGLKEAFLIGTSKYFLANTKIPVFM